MIAVDTSALVRVFLREPGYEVYQRAIFEARTVHLPLSCIVEFALLMRLGEQRIGWLRLFMTRETTLVVGNDPQHLELALEAASKFGKGSRHPARLNFGDCLVYAAAKYRNLPLLYVGGDFSQTDLKSALS